MSLAIRFPEQKIASPRETPHDGMKRCKPSRRVGVVTPALLLMLMATIRVTTSFSTTGRGLSIHDPFVGNNNLHSIGIKTIPIRHDRVLFHNPKRVHRRSCALRERVSTDSEVEIKTDISTGVILSNEYDTPSVDKKNDANVPPEGYLIILGLTFCVTVLSALDRVAMSVAVLPLSSEFHLTETVKGQISSALSAGYGLAIIPSGLVIASLSPRLAMAGGLLLWSLGTCLTPWAVAASTVVDEQLGGMVAESIVPLLVIRGVVGAAESVVLPTIQRILSTWVPPGRRSLAVAGVFSGFHLGTISAYLLSPKIIDFGGWRSMFYLYGAVGLSFLVPWLAFAKDGPDEKKGLVELQEGEEMDCKLVNTGMGDDASLMIECNTSDDSNNDFSLSLPFSSALDEILLALRAAPWKKMVSSPGVWAITFGHAANNWGLYNTLAWTPTFYTEQYGLNVRDSALYAILPSVAGAVGAIIAGSIADKLINRYEIKDTTTIRKGFQSVALVGGAACLLTLASDIPTDPSVAQLLLTATMGLQSFNAAGYGPAAQEKAGEKWAGLLYSLTSLPGVLIGTGSVYLTGQILDYTDQDWSLVFTCNAVVNIIGAAVFAALYNSKKEFD